MTVGDRLAQARLTKGAQRGKAMTQTELARLVGVMPATVSQWESGTVTPSLGMIPKIAAALDVTAGYLAFGELAPVTLQPDPHLDERVPDETVRAAVEAEAARTRPASKRANGGHGPRRA